MTKLTSKYSVQNKSRLQAQLSPFSASPRRDGHRGSESGQVGANAIECELIDDLLSAGECKALGEGIFRSREVGCTPKTGSRRCLLLSQQASLIDSSEQAGLEPVVRSKWQ